MAKIDRNFAVAAAPQVADGTYNATLDAIAGTLTYADGLLLGASGEGQADSGIDVEFEALRELAGTLAGSFTRPPGRVIRRRVLVTIAIPFVGNREDTTAVTTVDGDFVPSTGLGALLGAAGFVVSAWGSGVGQIAVPGAVSKCSLLLYVNGQRIELLDCVVETMTVNYTSSETPVATFEVSAGSVDDVSETGLPGTLDFGVQATVRAPIVESVGHAWGATRGFSELEIEISNEVEDTPDSNAVTGLIPERTDREITISATIYKDSSDEDFEWTQLGIDEAGSLTPLAFMVGTAAAPVAPALAIAVSVPMPEAQSFTETTIGDKAAVEVEVIARHTSADAELSFIFR